MGELAAPQKMYGRTLPLNIMHKAQSTTASSQLEPASLLFTAFTTALSPLLHGDLQIHAEYIRISARAVVPVALRSRQSRAAPFPGRAAGRSSLPLCRSHLSYILCYSN